MQNRNQEAIKPGRADEPEICEARFIKTTWLVACQTLWG